MIFGNNPEHEKQHLVIDVKTLRKGNYPTKNTIKIIKILLNIYDITIIGDPHWASKYFPGVKVYVDEKWGDMFINPRDILVTSEPPKVNFKHFFQFGTERYPDWHSIHIELKNIHSQS